MTNPSISSSIHPSTESYNKADVDADDDANFDSDADADAKSNTDADAKSAATINAFPDTMPPPGQFPGSDNSTMSVPDLLACQGSTDI